MADRFSYMGTTFIGDFIELYRSLPCLWQLKHKDYNNRFKKNTAYEILVNKCKEINPDADKDYVVKKINSLRTSFRKEWRKVKDSMKSATSQENIYKPTLWYYNLLLFTADQEGSADLLNGLSAEEGGAEIKVDYSAIEDNTEDDLSYMGVYPEEMPVISYPSPSTSRRDDLDRLNMTVTSETHILPDQIKFPKKRKYDEETNMEQYYTGQAEPQEQCDIIGRMVSHKLRQMSKLQRLCAENVINQALFRGLLNQLTPESTIITPKQTASETLQNSSAE